MKVDISVTVNDDELKEWVDFCTKYNDLFMQIYCGYWARGMKRDDDLGWLVFESADEVRRGDEPDYERAKREWRIGNKLPKGYYRLDEAMAARAFEEGVKRYGADWYDQGDASRYDVVIQLAMLGEIRYG